MVQINQNVLHLYFVRAASSFILRGDVCEYMSLIEASNGKKNNTCCLNNDSLRVFRINKILQLNYLAHTIKWQKGKEELYLEKSFLSHSTHFFICG